MSRTPESICIVGAQKTGKSTLADEIIQASNRKTLIIDSEGLEKLWWKYPIIKLEDLQRFKSGTARIIFDEDDPNFFKILRRTFFGGMLVFDDAAFFLIDRRAEHFRKLLMKNRQTNNDIVLIFHGISEVPPNFWTFISVLFLFNTTDSMERIRESVPNFMQMRERVLEAREKAKKNRFYRKAYRFR